MSGGLASRDQRLGLSARWLWCGEDLLVAVEGGEKPHIGAVAMATPRPSLADPARSSATASVFCYLGHKEDGLAKDLAEALAAALNVRVVVTAGAHWDGLGPQEIAQVEASARDLGRRLLAALTAERAKTKTGGGKPRPYEEDSDSCL
ncbi:MAG: hypothetical protein ACOZHQ_18145 [Thermodesulfobacteriota bacterium]